MIIFPHLSLLTLILLIQTALSLYSPSPISQFQLVDPTSIIHIPTIKLSPSGNKLAVSYLNVTDLSLQYKIMTLTGQEQCKLQHDYPTRYLIAWPPQSGLMFLANDNVTVSSYQSQCDQLSQFTKLEHKPERFVTLVRDNNPFIIVSLKNEQNVPTIREYNINTKRSADKLNGSINDTIKSLIPSDDGKLLYISGSFLSLGTPSPQQKIRVLNTESNSIQFEINTALQPIKIIQQGYSCLGMINRTLTKLDRYNNTKSIHQLDTNQFQGDICTRDNLFVTVKYTNFVEKIELFVYDSKDGTQLQKIQLDFIPVPIATPLSGTTIVKCNEDSLLLLGADGIVRIFNYTPPEKFPIWAIVLISVTVLVIIVAVGNCIYKRKKKTKKQRGFGKYSSLLD